MNPRARTRPVRSALAGAAVALALLLPGARASAAPLDATTRDFDQLHVIVRVTPHLEQGAVDGETTIRFAPTGDGFTVLRLHCQETQVLGVKDGAGAPLPFRLEGDVLAISFPTPIPKGTASEATVRYRSTPTAGLYFHAPTATSPNTPLEMYSQGQGKDNRRWIPCYDEPDDRATVEVVATVRKDLETVANGVLASSTPHPDGTRTDRWTFDHRIPTYLISLIVADRTVVRDTWDGIPLEYLAPAGREAEMKEGCSGTPAMMAFFSEYTGRRYPWPRYAQTTVWDFVYGGMENASCTTMNMRVLHGPETRPSYAGDHLVAHELAHQWFGDLLTCRTFDHLWLNEGFATYFTDLFFEHRDGPERFAFERWGQNRGTMDGTPTPHTLGLVKAPRGDLPLELHGGKEYGRGAAVLHQLRLELGDDVFRAGIRRYVKEHEDQAVVSEDLRRSMEREAGTDLRWFFDQWVYGAGYPVLAARLDGTTLTVEQTQPAGGGQTDVFRLSVPLRYRATTAEGGTTTRTTRLDLRRRTQTFALPSDAAKETPWVRLGDGGGLFARVRLSQPRKATELALGEDPDPTGRMEALEALLDRPVEAAALLEAALPREPSAEVRTRMVRELFGGAGARARRFEGALADPDPRVREALADVLGGTDRAFAGAALGALAASDRSPYVRAAAARSLGRVKADGAFEALEGLLATVDSHREVVRSGAFDGLRALGDPRAIPLARRHLAYDFPRGDHHHMRHAALDTLLALAPDDPDAHAAVVPLLDDVYHRMRTWAAEACGTYGIRGAEARLRTMAERDPDGGTKAAAKAALERLAGKKGS